MDTASENKIETLIKKLYLLVVYWKENECITEILKINEKWI